MELPFVTHNAELLGIVAPQLEAELTERLAEKTFSEQAKGILKHLLTGQRPGIQDLARDLHLSTRTLQRRVRATFHFCVGVGWQTATKSRCGTADVRSSEAAPTTSWRRGEN